MSESWIRCPGCGLKHRLRPEGTCPRCQAAVVQTAVAGTASMAMAAPALEASPVGVSATDSSSEEAPENLSHLRWAGAVMVANVVLVVAELFLFRYELRATMGSRIPGLVIDGVLGVLLLLGQHQHRSLVAIRATLGGVVFTLLHAFQGQLLAALIQSIFSIALLTLLSASTSRLRGRLALGAVLVTFVLEGVGVHLVLEQHEREAARLHREMMLNQIKLYTR